MGFQRECQMLWAVCLQSDDDEKNDDNDQYGDDDDDDKDDGMPEGVSNAVSSLSAKI